MNILDIVGLDKESRKELKEINVKKCIAATLVLMSTTVVSDNLESLLLVMFMIVSAFILLWLSKKR